MLPMDTQPNSYKSKREQAERAQEEKKIEKVTTGRVTVKKKNELSKFAGVFISEDIKNVKNFVLMDVLVPAIKKAISDIVTNGIDMILYGESGRNRKTGVASNVSYRSFYDRHNDGGNRTNMNQQNRFGCSFNGVTLESRGEAEEVLLRLEEIVATYGVASVSDLYDLVGVSGNFTDNKYGWTSVRAAAIMRVSDGYLLKLPSPMPID